MIRQLMAALLASVSLSALAAETPTPVSDDNLVCTQKYYADRVTTVHLVKGHATTIEVDPSEKIKKISVSDTAHLKASVMEDSWVFWMMPISALPPQPITIVTTREDGSQRIYLQQVDTPAPAEEEAQDQSPGLVNLVGAATPPPAAKPPQPCYLVRYIYPEDVVAKAKAKADKDRQVAASQWKSIHDAALLHEHQAAPESQNTHYLGRGNADLAANRTFDDGYSTFLEFWGNKPIPAAFEVGPDKKDRLLDGWNAEEGACPGGTAVAATCLKLHGVYKQIMLRDREDLAGTIPALKIYNRAWNAIGKNPGTGTSSPFVKREIKQ